jgi:hypothetical protein
MNRITLSVSTLVLLTSVMWTVPAAQSPRALMPADYGRWEQLAAPRTPLSPDGKWLVYGITRSSRQNELRMQPSDGGTPVVAAFGEQPAFSDDSRWLAYLIGFSEEQEAKLRKDKKPLHKSLGLLELATGKTATIAGVRIVLVQSQWHAPRHAALLARDTRRGSLGHANGLERDGQPWNNVDRARARYGP